MKRQKGFTIVEVVASTIIFALLMGFFYQALQWGRNALSATDKTFILTKFKNASYLISRELSCATEFLYPNKVGNDISKFLVFKNLENQVVTVYLGQDGLMLYNYNKNIERNLFPLVTSFKAKLIQDNLMEYEIGFTQEKMSFSVHNRLTIYNSLP